MNREDRAKQFLPFDAMKGLKEAMHERREQHLHRPMRHMSTDFAEELSRTLSSLVGGEQVTLLYHEGGREHEVRATVEEVCVKKQILRLSKGGLAVPFSQIIRLENDIFEKNS